MGAVKWTVAEAVDSVTQSSPLGGSMGASATWTHSEITESQLDLPNQPGCIKRCDVISQRA